MTTSSDGKRTKDLSLINTTYLPTYVSRLLVEINYQFTLLSEHVFAILAPYLVPVTQMALTGSVHTTVALTIERYISVVVPFFRQRNNLKAWIFILPVAIFAIAYRYVNILLFEHVVCFLNENLVNGLLDYLTSILGPRAPLS